MAASAFRPAAFLGILAIARGASSSPFWRSDGAAPAALLARAGHAMTYDSARKRVVLFGGFGASYMNDTWEHDGISWTLQAPGPPGLTPRDCPVMAFDAARAKVILFGGDDSIVEYNDTWEYDAAGWTPGPAAPPGLTPRHSLAAAFDSPRSRTVIFGGKDSSGPRNDTWEMDGVAWLPGPAAPPGLTARDAICMSYDAARSRIVIFGGNDGTTPLDDTWEYDGIAWSPGAPPPAGMVPRFWPSIAYDAARALSVTFGGKTATGYVNDAWEYDGTAWAPGATAGPALDARESFAMAAFPEAGGLILFGGYDGAESKADTWLYQTIAIDPPVLPRAVIGRPYAITLAATGGSAPRAFALTAGSLPAGLTLSAGGVLSGTPAIASTATFLVRASDGGGNAGSRRYVLEVTPVPDYVTGEGLGPGNENRVAAYDETGAPTPVDFRAYSAGSWGVNVSGGNVDPDAHDEIVTGPGPGATLGPHVRGFRFDGSPISKVTFFAYGTLRYGVNAAAASIDTDPFAEVVTGAGPGPVFGPHVRAFTYDGVAVAPIPGVSFFAYATPRYGVNASGGDIDGDAYAEIVTGAGPSPVFAPQVRTWDYDDDAIAVGASFQAFLPPQFGVNVAAGDFDRDGLAELAATPGPGPALTSQFVGFDVAGATVTAMPGFAVTPFATYYGGRVGSGDVDGNSDVELLTGAGRDPVATSTVLSFAYSGSALVPAGASFTPFPGGYGVNASSAALGY